MLGTGVMVQDIRLFMCLIYVSYLKIFRWDTVTFWPKMNKVVCNFLYYRRYSMYCHMYLQCPRISTGKTPSFILPRLKQQFATVVL